VVFEIIVKSVVDIRYPDIRNEEVIDSDFAVTVIKYVVAGLSSNLWWCPSSLLKMCS